MLQLDQDFRQSRPVFTVSLILAILFFSLLMPLLAEDKADQPADHQTEEEKTESKKIGLTALPILYYTPETKLAFGAGGILTYRFGLVFKETRPSTLYFAGLYTLMKQYSFQIKPEVYLKNNSFFLAANFLAERFPTKFWGIGPQTTEDQVEEYTPQTYFMELGYQGRFFHNLPLYLGIRYHLEKTYIVEKEPGKLIDQGLVPGSQGGWISGPGLIVNYDNRDNIFYPSSGYYLQFFGFWNNRIFGSSFNYLNFVLDARRYLEVGAKQVLVLQGFLETASGNVPFYKFPKIGGNLLRGYYGGRFRDHNILAFQTEYRFPIWKKLSGVAFAGLGTLADSIKHFSWDNLKYSAGFGLRFKVIPREKVNIRIDFAFGPGGTSGIYMSAGEVF
ncbi:MAG: BamA/TamA family outer membrane protein [Acidobacteriota bacterium]|nr:BamA/TamA family outer membrane protein [Acidobacteriota bacterium]